MIKEIIIFCVLKVDNFFLDATIYERKVFAKKIKP